ncbi:MAG TPA: carboxypeptidase regulatory-like domain-containing protein [Xanthobacteraceae bacterium]|nr:carboxypeptidase regulatory-like domain-containing protein [Xanthobacteraceae bacterium]
MKRLGKSRICLAATTMFALGSIGNAVAADAALTGQVSSVEEGAMEGVLVSAQKDGSTIRTTVVSDAQGRYAFPANRLEPGTYKISIRAVGYDLAGPAEATVAADKAASADLKLKKTADLAAQLTNSDWMASLPDAPQRRIIATCTSCHTMQRIIQSKYTADDFMNLVPRMMRYGAMSMPNHPQVAPDRSPTSAPKGEVLSNFARYLASINRSTHDTLAFPLKTAPRPSGRATRVIITEYTLPRPDLTEPHDVAVDPTGNGHVWYSNFGEQSMGELDPKTGKVTEYPLPLLKPGAPTGSLNLEFDPAGNPWVAMMYQQAVAMLDRKSGQVKVYPLSPDKQNPKVQIGMLDPHNSNVDGKVWFAEGGSHTLFRLDPKTGDMDQIDPFRDVPKNVSHAEYGIASDAQNNLWFFDFADRNVGRTDQKTGATTLFAVPTAASRPRRGHWDPSGRITFAEFAVDRVGVIDTRTDEIKEWPLPANFSPYDAVMDHNSEIWTGGMNADTIFRIDTKSGQSVGYLLPEETNIRRVTVDNSTTPVTFWVGNNHRGKIIKVEPLD